MTDSEIKDFLSKAKIITKEVCKSKETARKFLLKWGYITEDGELAPCYRSDDIIK